MEDMRIQFPNEEYLEFEYGKPIIILGANGAGKTRFSVKIESLNDKSFSNYQLIPGIFIHRLSAQKKLSISDSISILDNESAKKNLYLGGIDEYATKKERRFYSHPETNMIDDYNEALSLLFSEANRELQEEHNKYKKAFESNRVTPSPITTVVEKVTAIWNELLPHRTIDLSGNGVHVNFEDKRYHGKEMSDGERVMLYMICQVLVQRTHTLLIIDEPELHIHKSIVNKLWALLEKERQDCIFMYITHDLDFATSHSNAKTIWIKSYDGDKWEYELLDSNDYEELPQGLLYEIIGTRQKILFVEGDKNSYDHQLYSEIYGPQGYHVISCGSCKDVIRLVKAKRTYEKLKAIDVYGIIDRDFRNESEIEALKEDGIYCLSVAEVENLFVVPELLEIMENALACDKGIATQAKDFIKSLYEQNKESQIALALAQEIKFNLSIFDLGKEKCTAHQIKEKIDETYSTENIGSIIDKNRAIFDEAKSVEEILKVFNFKSMSKKIGDKLGITSKDYPKRVLNLIRKRGDDGLAAIEAIKKYTPVIQTCFDRM